MKLRCGTRGSPLALAQADWVSQRLSERHPGLEIERVVIHTSGDRFSQNQPGPGNGTPGATASGSSLPEQNVKAMFVKEIEDALSSGSVDFAVHSCKDLPGALPAGLGIAAYPKREEPRDAYIGGAVLHWRELGAGHRVGTASLRRQIQLQSALPHVKCVPMRGNVDTRLRKLEKGEVTGLVLAAAGLRRLGLGSVLHELIPCDVMVPAPGQGILALEAREDRSDVLRVLTALDDAKARLEAQCEREFLLLMGGGCRTPLGAHAVRDANGIHFDYFWSDVDGRELKRGSFDCIDFADFKKKAASTVNDLKA